MAAVPPRGSSSPRRSRPRFRQAIDQPQRGLRAELEERHRLARQPHLVVIFRVAQRAGEKRVRFPRPRVCGV